MVVGQWTTSVTYIMYTYMLHAITGINNVRLHCIVSGVRRVPTSNASLVPSTNGTIRIISADT